MNQKISAIILTYNEELNLEQCLKSIADLVTEIIIVDSGSTDKTLEIAKRYGAKIYEHQFTNQAEQFNWALDNIDIKGEWIFKLDADEFVLPELRKEIEEILLNTSKDTNGFYIKRRVYFIGRWIKHGGYYPVWFLRLWRNGKGRVEDRKMDEHIVISGGESAKLKNDFVDDNQKGLKAWIEKHKKYASREAEEVYEEKYGKGSNRNFYYRTPAFLRVFLYFIYRYFFRLGFLDGIAGLVFHFLHGFWYRWLVDVEIFKLYQK